MKTRVTLFTLAIFLTSIWSLSFYASYMLRADMQRLLGDQQSSTVSFVAAEINREINDRMSALKTVAGRITPEIMSNQQALQAFLNERTILNDLFNGGVVILNKEGTVDAEIAVMVERIGTNYMDAKAVTKVLKDGSPSIGSPVVGKKLQVPIFPIIVAIKDTQGAPIGALAGVINLSTPNFLEQLTNNTYGKNGYYLLEDPETRLIITGTGKTRMMQPLPAAGINWLIDHHVQGFDETGVTTNPLGVEVLASAKRIPVANWFVVAALPTEEAFAPIHLMQQRVQLATLFLTLLAGILTWWMLRRQLSPMLEAINSLAVLSTTDQHPQPLAIAKQDEIGDLIAGFNRLLASLGQRDEALKVSEQRFRDFFEKNSSVMLLIEPSDGTIIEANDAAAAYYGYPIKQLVSMSIADLNTMPAERIAEEREKARREERNYFLFLHRLASGEVRDVEVHSTPIEGNGHTLLFSIVHDIGARKDVLTALKASESWFRSIFENANTGIASVDSNGRITSFNESFRALLGYDTDELGGMSIADITHHDDLSSEVVFFDEIIAGKRNHYNMTKRYVASDGHIVWIDLFATAIRDELGAVANFIGIISDITERKQAEEQLRIAATAFESQEGMIVTDAQGIILRVNRAFTEHTGYTAEEVIGQTPQLLQSGRHPPSFYQEMWQTIRSTGGWRGEVWDRRKNGEIYPKWLTISAVYGNDQQVTHYIGTHYDISERKKAEFKIEALAFFDQLTNLPNRTLLLDRLKQAMATSGRSGRYSALLFIDLDNFKTLNDSLGHDAGDLLLKQVAQRLTHSVRECDSVARFGGDEFVIILASLSTSEKAAANMTEAVVKKILEALKQAYQIGHITHHSTASVGATLFRGNASPIDELLKQADLSMYKSKAAGRNTFCFFDPAMEIAVKERVALEGDLRLALKKNQFFLNYQPQIHGHDRLTGAEVLLRWKHPERGIVSPAEFIPLAEESGLILSLGDWVLETSCKQLAVWAACPEMAHLSIAVNVSAVQLRQHDFVGKVISVLSRTGANPQRLKLELTESLLVHNVEEIIDKMSLLKARGVGFSLDDFGTGYSSLTYLKRLPLDQLKIDQSFVRDVLIDPNDAAIAKTIVALADSLGLGVIAEGVETAAQRDFLASAGCHAYQGYFFSRPLVLSDFEAFARKGQDGT